MMSPIERAARALCERSGVANPDDLEPGNDPYSDDTEIIDGYLPNGDPGFFVWRLYVEDVRAVLLAIREPSEGMEEAAGNRDTIGYEPPPSVVWRAMIDVILENG